MGFGYGDIANVLGGSRFQSPVRSAAGIHKLADRRQRERQDKRQDALSRDRLGQQASQFDRQQTRIEKESEAELDRSRRMEVGKALALLNESLRTGNYGQAEVISSRLKALGHDLDVTYDEPEEQSMQAYLGEPARVPKDPIPEESPEAKQLEKTVDKHIGGFAGQKPAVMQSGVMPELTPKQAEQETGQPITEEPEPVQQAGAAGATAATAQAGQGPAQAAQAARTMGIPEERATYVVRGPDGETVAVLNSPAQRRFRARITPLEYPDPITQQAHDDVAPMVEAMNLPFDQARELYYKVLAEKEARLSKLRQAEMFGNRSRGGGGAGPDEISFSRGRRDERTSVASVKSQKLIETYKALNKARRQLKEIEDNPDASGALISGIVYYLAESMDPGARKTNEDIKNAMGYKGKLENFISEIEHITTERGVSDTDFANVKRAVLSNLAIYQRRVKNAFLSRRSQLNIYPPGEYRAGAETEQNHQFEGLPIKRWLGESGESGEPSKKELDVLKEIFE